MARVGFDSHWRYLRRYAGSASSSVTPRPARRLARALSTRRRKRGSFSRRSSNQPSSDTNPIRTPAGFPCRAMTISSRSASRRKRDKPPVTSESGPRFIPALRIARAVTRPPIWRRSRGRRWSCARHHTTREPRRRATVPCCRGNDAAWFGRGWPRFAASRTRRLVHRAAAPQAGVAAENVLGRLGRALV